MRPITIVLFLIIISCKSETKTENEINSSVFEIWNNYTKSNPEFKNNDMPESWYFHNNKEDADRLAKLTMTGNKTASSGLYSWYKTANADLPKTGLKHIITDFDGIAQAIIEIKNVDTIPFNQISEAYAKMDMGTSIEPLKKWKKAHWDFFENTMEESGEKPSKDMLVVCEIFETIWTKED
jgi:uncharacterized protein YhfF